MVDPRISELLLAEEVKKIVAAATELAKEAVENTWLTVKEQQESLDFLYHIAEDCDRVMRYWTELYLEYYLAGTKELRLVDAHDRPNKVFFIPACPQQCSNCSGFLVDYYCLRKLQCPCRCHNALIRKMASKTFRWLSLRPSGNGKQEFAPKEESRK
jgi:hypothetical protein